MSKKFTEEQYQKIVDFQEKNYNFNTLEGSEGYVFWLRLINIEPDIAKFARDNELIGKLVALANPVTREWAHEQFVEKEKKYYWSTKKKNGQGKSMNLFYGAGGISQMIGPKQLLTESEIREWGYNPEMFDKEEVY